MKTFSIPKLKRRNDAVTITHDHLKNNIKVILESASDIFIIKENKTGRYKHKRSVILLKYNNMIHTIDFKNLKIFDN